MNIETIYNTVKPSLIDGATVDDIKHDPQATAYEYAYMSMLSRPRLKTIEDIKNDNGKYNALFMDYYLTALKVLTQ
jgi:hypothetical protein